MLFSKNHPPRCEYCVKGTTLSDGKVFCMKRGIMTADQHCFKFRYDPLRRVPPRPAAPDFSRLKRDDFSL